MQVRLEERVKTGIVGVVDCRSSADEMDISGLWAIFEKGEAQVKRAIPGLWYEVHFEDEKDPTRHWCLVGVGVEEVEDTPIGMVAKILPAGEYAVFTHTFRDGGFDLAYRDMNDWIEASDYQLAQYFDLQVYDHRFKGTQDPESIIEIWEPVIRKPGR